jgi:hypothetical protein
VKLKTPADNPDRFYRLNRAAVKPYSSRGFFWRAENEAGMD